MVMVSATATGRVHLLTRAEQHSRSARRFEMYGHKTYLLGVDRIELLQAWVYA
jgi:hypothetical protein